jgi:glycine/serine hydroxymethyltransferase
MEAIAAAIARLLESGEDAAVAAEVKRSVAELCAAFPLV